jgi:hypothetical protein
VAASSAVPAGLPLDAASWARTPLVVRQVVAQLLAVIQRQAARIGALEARVSRHSRNSDRPPSPDSWSGVRANVPASSRRRRHDSEG